METSKTYKPSDLLLRTLSGLIYAGLIVLSLYDSSPYPFFVLFTLFYLLAIPETIKIWRIPRYFGFIAVAFWLMLSVPFLSLTGVSFVSRTALSITLLLTILFTLIYTYFRHGLSAGFRFTGAFLYLALALASTFSVLFFYRQPLLILITFILIWANDTFAYLTGKNFGKHPLAPSVSPKKTIEGLIGGMTGTVIVAFLLKYTGFLDFFSNGKLVLFALSISILATLGDLFESYLKRKAGVKDSGNIMPGHGGILDRLDSYFFVIPALFVYLIFTI